MLLQANCPFYAFISLFICITCTVCNVRLIFNAIPLVSFVKYNLIGVCHFHLCLCFVRFWLIPCHLKQSKKLHSRRTCVMSLFGRRSFLMHADCSEGLNNLLICCFSAVRSIRKQILNETEALNLMWTVDWTKMTPFYKYNRCTSFWWNRLNKIVTLRSPLLRSTVNRTI